MFFIVAQMMTPTNAKMPPNIIDIAMISLAISLCLRIKNIATELDTKYEMSAMVCIARKVSYLAVWEGFCGNNAWHPVAVVHWNQSPIWKFPLTNQPGAKKAIAWSRVVKKTSATLQQSKIFRFSAMMYIGAYLLLCWLFLKTELGIKSSQPIRGKLGPG